MARKTAQDKTRELFHSLKIQATEETTLKVLNSIRRDAKTLHRYYEGMCSGIPEQQEKRLLRAGLSWDQVSEKNDLYVYWCEAMAAKVEKRIKRNAIALGLHVHFQRDPRGMPVYLSLQPIPADNYHFNNDTVAVG